MTIIKTKFDVGDTVNYDGNTITVPESMLSSIKPVIYENLEEED
jgi:hypothetical protein